MNQAENRLPRMSRRLANLQLPHAAGVVAALFFLAVLTAALIGTSRFSEGEIDWSTENRWLLTGTLLIATAAFLHASLYWSPRRALELLLCSVAISFVAEWCGIHFGFPFGDRYAYHEDLTPRIFGQVPLFIPIAWFSLLYTALVILESVPPRQKGRDRTGLKVLLAASLVTAGDLYLDPLAIDAKAWVWEIRGKWFGVPLSNYAGWWLVSGAIYGIFHSPLFPGRPSLSGNVKLLRWIVWIGLGLMTAGVLFCLNVRIESGWKALAAANLVLLAALVVWRLWGRSPASESPDS